MSTYGTFPTVIQKCFLQPKEAVLAGVFPHIPLRSGYLGHDGKHLFIGLSRGEVVWHSHCMPRGMMRASEQQSSLVT